MGSYLLRRVLSDDIRRCRLRRGAVRTADPDVQWLSEKSDRRRQHTSRHGEFAAGFSRRVQLTGNS